MRITLPPAFEAFLWSIMIAKPGRQHKYLLNLLDIFKVRIQMMARYPGGHKLPEFIGLLLEMHHYLTKGKYSRLMNSLIEDLELLNDGTYKGMLQLEDARTLLLRLERISKFQCGYFSFTGNPEKLKHFDGSELSVQKINASDISFGGAWGIPQKTMHGWWVKRADTKEGVRGTSFFDSMNTYKIMNHYAASFMKEEVEKLSAVIARMTEDLEE